jgi:general secretion pathway protein D
VIITGISSTIRRLVEIISQIDDHEASIAEMHIIQLKHANAAATAKLIESLLKSPGAAGAPAQQLPPQMMQGPPQNGGRAGGGGATGSEHHEPPVVAVADDRTNTLLIMAPAAVQKMIDLIVSRIDADNPNPTLPTETHIYPLHYAVADATAKLISATYKAPADNSVLSFIYGARANSDDTRKPPVTAVSDDRTNSVVVTGPSERFPEIEKLIHQLDTSPTVSQDLRVIHLKYAVASDVEKLIQEMFQSKKEGDNRSPIFYLLDAASPDQQKVRDATINVTSDFRTNTLLVTAPRELLDLIEKTVRDLDSDSSSEDTLFIYHLRNSQSTHLEYTLNVLFGNISAQNGNNQQNGPNPQNPNPQPQQNPTSTGGPGTANSLSSTGNNAPTQRNGRNYPGTNRPMSAGIAQAANELTGEVLVVAEPDTNALLVTTASKYEKQVRRIIEDLDQPVPQVLIKVLMAEVAHDDTDDTGTDFSVLNLRPSGNGQELATTFGKPTNGLVATVLEKNLDATLHALAVRGKLDVLSRPYILASDNQLATITVGESVPFITESRLDTNNNTINTVQYQDIGIILNVTPHINPDGLVILDVSPEISSMTQTTIALSPGVNSPVFQRRSADSRVGIVNGQTIVIGGLMQDQNTTTLQKVPFLGDIPLLGLLFQRNQVEKQKTELLIFLTPHVVQQPSNLQGMSDDEMRGTQLTPHAVGPGVFDAQIQGLGRGQAPPGPTTQMSPVKTIDLSGPDAPAQPKSVAP